MKTLGIVSLAVGVFLMAGCGGAKIADELGGQQWKLTKLYKNSVEVPVNVEPDEQGAFVEFKVEDNAFNGNAGCNGFFGSYALTKEGALQFSGVGMTRKMCAPKSMAVEDTLVRLFSDEVPTSVKIESNGTMILENKEVKAVFSSK